MEGESSATTGNRLNYRLTATPSAAGANPPNTCPITARLLEIYQECIENGVWAHVLYEARDGIFFNRTYRLFLNTVHCYNLLEDYCYYEIQIHKALCEFVVEKGHCWFKEASPPNT